VLTVGGLIMRTVSAGRDSPKAGSLTLHSVRDTREVLRASRQFFTEGGWTLLSRSEDANSFSYELRPSPALLVLLLLLGIVPGLIYLATARTSLRVTVTSTGDGRGSATRIDWNNSVACERACRDFAGMIRDQEPERGSHRPRRSVRRPKQAAPDSQQIEEDGPDRAR
jgi:hypothetical protein